MMVWKFIFRSFIYIYIVPDASYLSPCVTCFVSNAVLVPLLPPNPLQRCHCWWGGRLLVVWLSNSVSVVLANTDSNQATPTSSSLIPSLPSPLPLPASFLLWESTECLSAQASQQHREPRAASPVLTLVALFPSLAHLEELLGLFKDCHLSIFSRVWFTQTSL